MLSTTRKSGCPGHGSASLTRQQGRLADVSRCPAIPVGAIVWSALPGRLLAFESGAQPARQTHVKIDTRLVDLLVGRFTLLPINALVFKTCHISLSIKIAKAPEDRCVIAAPSLRDTMKT